LRPGSPAFVLSMIMLACVIGMALLLSLTRRRGPKQTS
jgi:hypothetical protein